MADRAGQCKNLLHWRLPDAASQDSLSGFYGSNKSEASASTGILAVGPSPLFAGMGDTFLAFLCAVVAGEFGYRCNAMVIQWHGGACFQS